MSISVSISLRVCLSVCLSVCLFVGSRCATTLRLVSTLAKCLVVLDCLMVSQKDVCSPWPRRPQDTLSFTGFSATATINCSESGVFHLHAHARRCASRYQSSRRPFTAPNNLAHDDTIYGVHGNRNEEFTWVPWDSRAN